MQLRRADPAPAGAVTFVIPEIAGTFVFSAIFGSVRYFFHLYNDIDTQDEEGIELADETAARKHAEGEARTMAAESVRKGHLDLSHFIEVATDSGPPLFKVTFGEVVTVIR